MAAILPQDGTPESAASWVIVWDLPVRLFHWLLALSFAVAWLTQGDDRYLDVHVFAGYLMSGLLAFRLAWGVLGNRYARFRAFAFPWRDVRDYLLGILSGQAPRYLSHNPAGGWACSRSLRWVCCWASPASWCWAARNATARWPAC